MSDPHDRRLHAETLRRHLRYSQTRQFKRHLAIMLSSIALGGLAAPSRLLDPGIGQDTGTHVHARMLSWFAGSGGDPGIVIHYEGADYLTPARTVATDPYFVRRASITTSFVMRGSLLGFIAWLSGLLLLRRVAVRRRERALRDRVLGGTKVASEAELAKLARAEAGMHPLAIGRIPFPRRLETRRAYDRQRAAMADRP